MSHIKIRANWLWFTSYLLFFNLPGAQLTSKSIKRKLVTAKFPKGSYLGTANIQDIKTTDIVIAQRKRRVNDDGVSAVIAAYCNKDGVLTLTTDLPGVAEITMSVFVIYGEAI